MIQGWEAIGATWVEVRGGVLRGGHMRCKIVIFGRIKEDKDEQKMIIKYSTGDGAHYCWHCAHGNARL